MPSNVYWLLRLTKLYQISKSAEDALCNVCLSSNTVAISMMRNISIQSSRQQQNLIKRPAHRFGKASNGNRVELSNAGSWKVFAKALEPPRYPRASQRSLQWKFAPRRFKVNWLGEHSLDMTQNSEQLLLIPPRRCQRWQQRHKYRCTMKKRCLMQCEFLIQHQCHFRDAKHRHSVIQAAPN